MGSIGAMSTIKIRPCKVYFRIFPEKDVDWNMVNINDFTIKIRNLQEYTFKKEGPFSEFNTDKLFTNHNQNEMFKEITKDIPDLMWDGYSNIIIAFGQTGSGKTFTISNLEQPEDLGIIPRIIEDLFKTMNSSTSFLQKLTLQMTYLEFSNNVVLDLFKKYPNYLKGWNFKEATMINLSTLDEALKQIYLAEGRKTVVRQNNYWSNIHTSVCTIYLSSIKNDKMGNSKTMTSKLHIVDMAGIDTIGNPTSKFKTSTDIGNANLRMTNFEQYFLKRLVTLQRTQRTDPFLFFLDEDIKGSSVLHLIGHIKLTRSNLPATLSMLKFAQLVQNSKITVKEPIPTESCESKVKRLQEELALSKTKQYQDSALLNQKISNVLNEERLEHINKLILQYVAGDITELKILNVEDVTMVLKIFKEMCGPSTFEAPKSKPPSRQRAKRGGTVNSILNASISENSSVMSKGSSIIPKGPFPSPTSEPIKELLEASTSTPQKDDKSRKEITKKSRAQYVSVLGMKRLVSKSVNVATTTHSDTTLPSNEDVWRVFKDTLIYKKIMEQVEINEKKLGEVHQKYTEKMKVLTEANEELREKENEMNRIKLHLNFELLRQFDDLDNHNLALRQINGMFDEELKRMNKLVEEIREEVLIVQAELKSCINLRKELRKQIDHEHHNFCKERFNIVFSQLDTPKEPEPPIKSVTMSKILAKEEHQKSETPVENETVLGNEWKLMEFCEMMNRERIKFNKAKTIEKSQWK